MPRPRKRRTVEYAPAELTFKPVGRPLADLPQVWLSPDELEALRLADLEGLSQTEAGERMAISRSTFQRTLENARCNVARFLVEGTALVIGDAAAPLQRWRCPHCGHTWDVLENVGQVQNLICPHCARAIDEA